MAKIPSALKWLLTRRARLLGELEKTESRLRRRECDLRTQIADVEARLTTLRRRLKCIQTLRPDHLDLLRKDLTAIDRAIGQHPVLVDVDLIEPIRTQDNKWTLPHGQMSRLILTALREAAGEILTTTEVAVFVAREGKLEVPPEDYRSFKRAVRCRMRSMHAAGQLRRVEIGRNTVDSRWAASVTPPRSNERARAAENSLATSTDAAPAGRVR
jgi:hypothetical protein